MVIQPLTPVRPLEDVIRVVVASSQLAFAEALAIALEASGGIDAVAGLQTRDGADVVVVDLDPDAAAGLAAVEAVVDEDPDTRVVAIAGDGSGALCERALRAGASAFSAKTSALAEIVHCVRAAATDQSVVPAPLLTYVIGGARLRPRMRLATRLTDRELEILRLCSVGLSTKAIAAHLVVSVNTVRTHVQNALTKLGAHSRLEAVAKALSAGLLETPARAAL